MKNLAIIIFSLIVLSSCNKDNCTSPHQSTEYHAYTFTDSTYLVTLIGQIYPTNNTCEFEINEAPINGSIEIIDEASYTYTPNPDFTGIDEIAYTDLVCNEGTLIIKVWASPSELCLSEINNIQACTQINTSSSESTGSTTIGYPVINPDCYPFLESVEILEEPELGTAEFDGEYLRYTHKRVKGKDKIKIRLCLNLENTIVCNERTWSFELKLI